VYSGWLRVYYPAVTTPTSDRPNFWTKPRSGEGILGCFGLVLFLLMGIAVCGGQRKSGSSGAPSANAPKANSLIVRAEDGSELTFTDLVPIAEWACGTRKRAVFEGGDVILYFDRAGTLVSANVPEAGNQKFYERDPSRKCLKNWLSDSFEMLTESEYRIRDRAYRDVEAERKRLERKARTRPK
jgi:hypothetical protein